MSNRPEINMPEINIRIDEEALKSQVEDSLYEALQSAAITFHRASCALPPHWHKGCQDDIYDLALKLYRISKRWECSNE